MATPKEKDIKKKDDDSRSRKSSVTVKKVDKLDKVKDPKAKYAELMSPDNPLTEVKEAILKAAAESCADEEIKTAEQAFKKSAMTEQAKFDYAVTLVRSRKPPSVETGLAFLKDIYKSFKWGHTDATIARACLYYIAFASFRMMKFTAAISFCQALLAENPSNLQAKALSELCRDIILYPTVFEQIVKADKRDHMISPRMAAPKSKDASVVDDRNKEVAKTKKKMEEIKKKEDDVKAKEAEKVKEKEEKEAERKRKILEKRRQKQAEKGMKWVDNLADEFDDELDDEPAVQTVTPTSPAPPTGIPSLALGDLGKKKDDSKALSPRSSKYKKEKEEKEKKEDDDKPISPRARSLSKAVKEAKKKEEEEKHERKKSSSKQAPPPGSAAAASPPTSPHTSPTKPLISSLLPIPAKPLEYPGDPDTLLFLVLGLPKVGRSTLLGQIGGKPDALELNQTDIVTVLTPAANKLSLVPHSIKCFAPNFTLADKVEDLEGFTRANGFILTFSLKDPSSFDKLMDWFLKDNATTLPFFIVGTHQDDEKGEVPLEHVIKVSRDNQCSFFLVSCLHGDNVPEAVQNIVGQTFAAPVRTAPNATKAHEVQMRSDADLGIGSIDIEDIIASGFMTRSDEEQEDLAFIRANIAELEGQLSSLFGIDVASGTGPTLDDLTAPMPVDDASVVMRPLVASQRLGLMSDETIDMPMSAAQMAIDSIVPDIHLPSIGTAGDYSMPMMGLSNSMNMAAPAPASSRPWVVIRRFNKRGGKKIQLPETMDELKLLCSDRFAMVCVAIREADTEAEVDDIHAIRGDAVLWAMAPEEEAEFA